MNSYNLWNSIFKTIQCSFIFGAEGNSGEFHNKEEENELIEELIKCYEQLTQEFFKLTGFLPVWESVYEEWPIHMLNEGHWNLIIPKKG